MTSTTDTEPAGERVLPDGLTEHQADVLDFERGWWKSSGSKETAIREAFDTSSTRYYQELNAILDLPAALVYDPMLVRRLRRIRQARAEQRSARRLGWLAYD